MQQDETVVDTQYASGGRIWLGVIILLFVCVRLPAVLHAPASQDEEWYGVPGLTVATEGIPRVPYCRAREEGSVFQGAEQVLFAQPPLSFYAHKRHSSLSCHPDTRRRGFPRFYPHVWRSFSYSRSDSSFFVTAVSRSSRQRFTRFQGYFSFQLCRHARICFAGCWVWFPSIACCDGNISRIEPRCRPESALVWPV